MSRCLLVIWIAFLCISLRARSQQASYPFTHLDTRQGLSYNEINAIYKDAKGFMWFATMSGLNRYDGHDFRIFRHDPKDTSTVGQNEVKSIQEGPSNKLWMQFVDNTFNIYDPLTETFDRDYDKALARLGIPGKGITGIVKDSYGAYWFVHPQMGLFRYEPRSGKTSVLRLAPSEPTISLDNISDFCDDKHGHYWIIRRSGLLEELDGHTLRLLYTSRVVSAANQQQPQGYLLYADGQGDLWIHCTMDARGIWYFKISDHSLLHPHLDNDIVRDVVQDDAGMIWIATDHGGINLVNKTTLSIRYLQHNDFDENSVSQNAITCLYKDNTGMLWVGTYKQGVNQYYPGATRFPLYRHQPFDPKSLGFDDVNRFVEDRSGNLWIGTNGGGLIYFDRKTEKFTSYLHKPDNPNSLSNDVIISLCVDHEGKLWIGSYYGGLDCFDGKTFVHYRHNPTDSTTLADDRVWEVFEDKWQQLWVGMLAGGLDLMDRKSHRFLHHRAADRSPSVSSDYISEITQDTAGSLWVGTDAGIDVLNHSSGRWKHFTRAAGLNNDFIIALVTDSLGRVWAGTSEGLNLLDPVKGRVIGTWNRDDGLPDNYIQTIAEDNSHNLWMGTPSGLCNAILNGDGRHLQCINYDASSGLQSSQFNENAALRTREGEMVFGGPNGFNLFKPVPIHCPKEAPPLVFTSLQVFNRNVAPGEKLHGRILLATALPETREITLRYNENVFAISFADLDFSGNQKSIYSYQLEGFNPDWLTTGQQQRSATYTNLDPGTYTFRVRATPAGGSGKTRETSLVIHVRPPFWKTPVAFIGYVLFILGLLLLSRKILVERTRMRFRIEQERKEAQNMHELDMMKIRFFTNVSHEFRTPLSLILAPLEKLLRQQKTPDQQRQFQMIYRNARRLLNLVNQLLDFRKMEVQEFTLQRSADNIIRYVRELTQSFSDISEKRHVRLAFTTTAEECVTLFDKDKMEKIVFNLLSNAFKFTPEGGGVTVDMRVLPTFVDIRVIDTGIGIPSDQLDRIFERFFQHDLPGNMINQGSGIGLSLTKEFVKLHQGTISVESEPEKGSCFTVRLPIVTPENTDLPAAFPGRPAFGENGALVAERGLSYPGDREDVQLLMPVRPRRPETPMVVALPQEESDTSKIEEKSNKKPVLLLVEDNEDFRFYLKDNLKSHYHILEAGNGREGWGIVQSQQPDLIVSDIMMPEMDGIALARKIKHDARTSHIPVILLTARAEEEQQLEGYETGANDYITKPFNFELLQAKIRNLLAQRKAIHRMFQKHVEIYPSTITITPLDELFLKTAVSIVEQHLSDPDFSVEDLSRAVHFSRVTLYKKLLSLTGKAPLDFIRHIRLKRAADLLAKSQMTVAEVAYEVGFNDPKYFAKFFRKEFGVKPSDYKKSPPS